MKTILALLLLTTSTLSFAQEATYFRAWQGFISPKLTTESFFKELPTFMDDTVKIYEGRALVNYIVVVPPKDKPAFIPDELALVALTSREDYLAIRNTPEGQHYSDRHWDVFNKENSKSVDPMVDFKKDRPETLVHNQSYNVLGNPIDWQEGYNMVYIGLRKKNLSAEDFLKKLRNHLSLVATSMAPKGLKGYIVIANNDYEVAYLNWESKSAHDNAFATSLGKIVTKDGASILDNLMYEEAKAHDTRPKKNVQYGSAYSTLPASSK
jgi:hypothetical protein